MLDTILPIDSLLPAASRFGTLGLKDVLSILLTVRVHSSYAYIAATFLATINGRSAFPYEPPNMFIIQRRHNLGVVKVTLRVTRIFFSSVSLTLLNAVLKLCVKKSAVFLTFRQSLAKSSFRPTNSLIPLCIIIIHIIMVIVVIHIFTNPNEYRIVLSVLHDDLG